MAENLKNFIKKISEDPSELQEYRNDPHGTMDKHDLSDEEKRIVKEKDKEALKREAGLDDAQVNALII